MKILVVVLLALMISLNASADTGESRIGRSSFPSATPAKKSVLFGHNLAVTTQTLKKGSLTFGNFAAGIGVTDNLTIATSPWLLNSYNMYSLIGRARWQWSQNIDLGWQVAYFKTDTFYPNIYQMEAISNWWTVGYQPSKRYSLSVSLHHAFFMDETIPFSLRQEPFTDEPYQFSLSTLQTVSVMENYGLGIEAGVLGLNYKYPYAHLGISAHFQWPSWLVQLGVSASAIISSLDVYTQTQADSQFIEAGAATTVIHPEINLQYFF